jgi:hypothetical protein
VLDLDRGPAGEVLPLDEDLPGQQFGEDAAGLDVLLGVVEVALRASHRAGAPDPRIPKEHSDDR